MIINDLQRLRWQILDEALRNPDIEFFMGERTKTNETGNTRSLIHYVNQRLKSINKTYKCSKRMLQNDVTYFEQKGAKLEPRFRRGHKRILRYINLEWRNPLLKPAFSLIETPPASTLPMDGPLTPVNLRIFGNEQMVMDTLQKPNVLQRQVDAPNNTITIQAELPISDTLFTTILGLAADVEVLGPDTLRDRVKHAVVQMHRLYKKENATPKVAIQGDLFEGLM